MFAYNWTVGLFCPISPSPLKIKLKSTVLAEELTRLTSSDKGSVMFRGYDSGVVLREDIIERVR